MKFTNRPSEKIQVPSLPLTFTAVISVVTLFGLSTLAGTDGTAKSQDLLINGANRTIIRTKSHYVNLNKKGTPVRTALDVPSSSNRTSLLANTKAPRSRNMTPVYAGTLAQNDLTQLRPSRTSVSSPDLFAENNQKVAAVDRGDGPETSAGKMEGNEFSPNGTQNLKLDDKSNGELQHFHFRLRSYNAMDLGAAEGATGSYPSNPPGQPNTPVDRELRAWERIDLRYSFDEALSFAIMPQFSHTWFGDPNRTQDNTRTGLNQSYSFYVGNTALVLNDDKIFDLGNDFLVNGYARYDIPTSEASIMDNSVGEAWGKVGVAKKIGKYGVEVNGTYRKYFQQYTSSQLLDPTNNLLPAQNLSYRYITALDQSFEVNSWFSLFLEVGERTEMFYADASTNRSAISQNNLIVNPELDFTVSKHLSFALGIWELPNATVLDNNSYSPLTTDYQNANEAYLQMNVEF